MGCLRHVFRQAQQILLWAKIKLFSLRAFYILGHENLGANILSRQVLREWWPHQQVVESIWQRSWSEEWGGSGCEFTCLWVVNQLSPLALLELDTMVQTWQRLCLYVFPPIALLPGNLVRTCQDWAYLLLVAPFWLSCVCFSDLVTLLDSTLWEIAVQRDFSVTSVGVNLEACRRSGSIESGPWEEPDYRFRSLNWGCWYNSEFQSSVPKETICPKMEDLWVVVWTVLFLQESLSAGLSLLYFTTWKMPNGWGLSYT